MQRRKVYLMIQDVEGVADEDAGIEWGVDWGLAEGEELPEDVQDLTPAQYTVWRFIKVMQGLGNEPEKEKTAEQARDRPSGILVPR